MIDKMEDKGMGRALWSGLFLGCGVFPFAVCNGKNGLVTQGKISPELTVRFAVALFLSLAFLSTDAAAEELLGDPVAGQRLAEDVCSACHVIAPDQASTTNVDAPVFADLAKMPRVTALSLRVFLQTPHDVMPDLHLGRDEADDIIAYILSLDE